MTVSIAIAEDHEDLREGLRGLLEAQPDFEVVGEATDGLEALSLLERMQPDILLLDLRMPTLNGLEVIRQTEGRPQTTKILVLSMHDKKTYVQWSARHGASGYIVKDEGFEIVVSAIREVATGGQYFYLDQPSVRSRDRLRSLILRVWRRASGPSW